MKNTQHAVIGIMKMNYL